MSGARNEAAGPPAPRRASWARVATAVILAPVTLAAVWLAPGAWFAALAAGVAGLAAAEFYHLAERAGVRPYAGLGVAAAAGVTLALGWPGAKAAEAVVMLATAGVTLRALSQSARMAASFADAGATLLGALYVGLGIGAAAAVRDRFAEQTQGAAWVTLLLAVVWLGDVAALYAGKAWGHAKMAPQVSPHKTWVGAAASLGAAAAVAAVAGARWPGIFERGGGSWWSMALLGAGLNVAAQAGDLAESVFKRGAGVKDSGGLLPGHGGMLDRMDALLLAAPALWLFLAVWR